MYSRTKKIIELASSRNSDILYIAQRENENLCTKNENKQNECSNTKNIKASSCCKRLFTEDEEVTSPNKREKLDGNSEKDNKSLISKLESNLKIIRHQKREDEKAGKQKAARRKFKWVKQYLQAIDNVKNGTEIDPEKLPTPSPESVRPRNVTAIHTSYELEENVPEVNIKSKAQKRKGKKFNYCLYCNRLVKEYCIHIERHHGDTEEGRQLKNIKETNPRLRGKMKRQITDKLRKKANSMYNEMVLKEHNLGLEEKKVILVKNRHHIEQCTDNTSVCKYCHGYYKRDRMSVHLKLCPEKKKNILQKQDTTKTSIKEHIMPVSLLAEIEGASEDLKNEVLLYMTDDKVKQIALNDTLIMRFGSEFHRSRRDKIHSHYTASKIRDLTNLLIKMKEINPNILNFENCLNPANFDTLVSAALQLSGYDAKSGRVSVPSVAYRLSQPLNIAAAIAESDSLRKTYKEGGSDFSKSNMFKHFRSELNNHWANKIGRIATGTRKREQAGKIQKFALEEDIVKVCSFAVENYRKLLAKLKNKEKKHDTYNELINLLICHIMCLIRRRPVDFKRATILHYRLIDQQDELINMVSNTKSFGNNINPSDIEKCKKFHIFYVPGKNLQIVPIVLTPLMKTVLDSLIRERKGLNITDEEKLFVYSDGKPVDPITSIRKIKQRVSLKRPETFTNNGLRHQAATFSKLHTNHPQYQDFLASALGHSLVIHKKHYELPTSIIQKLVVCPILHKMTMGANQNKTEDDTEIDQERGNDISLSMSEEILEEPRHENTISDSNEKQRRGIKYEDDTNYSSNSDSENDNYKHKQSRKSHSRIVWSIEEKKKIFSKYSKEILKGKQPPRSDIKNFFNANKTLFANRTINSLYTYIHNLSKRKQLNVSPLIKKYSQH